MLCGWIPWHQACRFAQELDRRKDAATAPHISTEGKIRMPMLRVDVECLLQQLRTGAIRTRHSIRL